MWTLIVGLLINAVVVFSSFDKGTFWFYMQLHSIVLVIGGTIGTLFLTSPRKSLVNLRAALGMLRSPETGLAGHQRELSALVKDRFGGGASVHPLIAYAQELWSQGVDPDLIVVLLSERRKEIESRTIDAVQTIKNLSKYPPAFGMMGTVMGMISLFSSLGSNKESIGLSLSIAMTATFFGLFLSNLILSPLSDRLHVRHMHECRVLENIYEILLLINRDESSVLIRGELDDRVAA